MTPITDLINILKIDSVAELPVLLLDVLLVFAVPLIVLYIMYAGFLYVTARGNPGKIEKAHRALQWSIVGGFIVLVAHLISPLIEEIVKTL